jgi:hypothetical protein
LRIFSNKDNIPLMLVVIESWCVGFAAVLQNNSSVSNVRVIALIFVAARL